MFVFGSPTPRSFSDWRWGHVECRWSACLNLRKRSRNSRLSANFCSFFLSSDMRIICIPHVQLFILGMVTWSCKKCLMLLHSFSSILAGSIENIFYFFGGLPVNWWLENQPAKWMIYLMKITDVSTNQNPWVMGLFIWRSRKNRGYCWGKKSTFLVAGTAPLPFSLWSII